MSRDKLAIFESVLSALQVPILVCDKKGQILFANSHIKSVFPVDTDPQNLSQLGVYQVSEGWHQLKTPAGVVIRFVEQLLPDSSRAERLLIGHDISDLNLQIEELKNANSHLHTIIESEPACVKTITADGNLLEMNTAGLNLIEADSMEQVRGVSVYNLMEGQSLEDFKALNARVFKGETCSLDFEITGLKGTRRTMRTFASPLRNSQGEVISHVAVTYDISRERRDSETLKKALLEAEVAVKAKCEFLANMSHEIRTPMNGVLGMTELLLESQLSPEQRELTEAVKVSADGLLRVINDILDFSKITEGKIEFEFRATCLTELFSKIDLMFRTQVREKGLEFIAHFKSSGDSQVLIDADRLLQVLVNLIGNSLKFTRHGGIVLYAEEQANGNYFFAVIDSGVGVAKDLQKRIFQEFSQGDSGVTRIYGGTGLGLAISSKLINLMGGELRLRSHPGIGSSFYFEIPLQKSLQTEKRRAESSLVKNSDLSPVQSKHVLVVDDNAVNRKLASKILMKHGYSVELANNGMEAIDRFEKASFDLILMDIQMPVMGGEQAAQLIRKKPAGEKIPIVALTANAMKGDLKKYLELGMDAYISKPFVKEDLLRIMAELLSK